LENKFRSLRRTIFGIGIKSNNLKSARRRHDYKRLQHSRRFYWSGLEEPHNPKQSGMVVSTPQPCGKTCCNNPRKWSGQKTIQERRKFQRERY